MPRRRGDVQRRAPTSAPRPQGCGLLTQLPGTEAQGKPLAAARLVVARLTLVVLRPVLMHNVSQGAGGEEAWETTVFELASADAEPVLSHVQSVQERGF